MGLIRLYLFEDSPDKNHNAFVRLRLPVVVYIFYTKWDCIISLESAEIGIIGKTLVKTAAPTI